MKNLSLSLVFTLLSSIALAAPSAKRDLQVDYSSYLKPFYIYGGFPQGESSLVSQMDWTQVEELSGAMNLAKLFSTVRDDRYIQASPFERRPSFLYPDDGCFARAELMNNYMENLWQIRLQKIFVFGNLYVESANSPTGGVGWWYHVAPVTRIQGTVYVIDPSIEPTAPIEVSQWLARMSSVNHYKRLSVAICDANSYSPSEPCHNGARYDQQALMDQREFLPLEWDRILEMGRNPQAELTDAPPWKN